MVFWLIGTGGLQVTQYFIAPQNLIFICTRKGLHFVQLKLFLFQSCKRHVKNCRSLGDYVACRRFDHTFLQLCNDIIKFLCLESMVSEGWKQTVLLDGSLLFLLSCRERFDHLDISIVWLYYQ